MNSLCEMQNSVIAINKVAVIYNKIAVQAFWILKKAGSPIAGYEPKSWLALVGHGKVFVFATNWQCVLV